MLRSNLVPLSVAPRFVYWEATQACDLACSHCRADAVPTRHPLELSPEWARRLVDEVAAFGHPAPHLIITGGDPLRRPDLMAVIRRAVAKRVPVSVTPAGTPNLTPDLVGRLHTAGIASLGLSLDGSTAGTHDAFRGVEGSFYWTHRAARHAVAAGLSVQVNTMVTAGTVDDLPAVYDMVTELGARRWALFFLVRTGRGHTATGISAKRTEAVLNWVATLNATGPLPVKTTEAHHVRRIAYRRLRTQGKTNREIRQSPLGRGFGIRDGSGIVFVSHVGAVYPSGFLPVAAGNIRGRSLVDIYRSSELFKSLRDPDLLSGKCGRCEFRQICGGSRARAYAETGNPLASDPLCLYEPKGRQAAIALA